MQYTHDVIVIGAGAAGLTAAGGCGLFGLKVALIEGRRMGGECLNDGCVPSKALIAAARRAAQGGDRLGVALAAPAVDWAGVHAHVHGAIAAIAPHDSEERFEGMGCEVIRDHARLTGPHEVSVAGRKLTAPRIVLATGSQPALPPIAGLDDVAFLTNESIFELGECPAHLVVIGGGAIGMEMAQSFRRLGSAVTLIHDGPLLERDDPQSVALVQGAMEREGVRFVAGKAVRVSGAVAVELAGGKVIEGSHLLVATGRKARTAGFGLEELGVAIGANGITVDARRRTSLKHIYAIGDCRDGPRLTHAAGYEGSNVVMEIAFGLPAKADWRALPWCTYTDPEVAQIGLTEAQARAAYGAKVRVIEQHFDHNDRAVCEGEAEGHCKLVMKGGKVVGASICGPGAGDLLLPISQLITGKASTFALGSAVIPYPTRSEITKAAAFAAWEPTVFGPWPRRIAGLVQRIRRVF